MMFTEIDKYTMFKVINFIYDKFPKCVDDKNTKGIFYINFSNFRKDIYDYIFEIMDKNIQKRQKNENYLKQIYDFNNYQNELNYINYYKNNENNRIIKEKKNGRRMLGKKVRRSDE